MRYPSGGMTRFAAGVTAQQIRAKLAKSKSIAIGFRYLNARLIGLWYNALDLEGDSMARSGAFTEQRVQGDVAKSSASQQPKAEAISYRQGLEAFRRRSPHLSDIQAEAAFESATNAGIIDYRRALDGTLCIQLKSPTESH
jgi:hypothetical protein